MKWFLILFGAASGAISSGMRWTDFRSNFWKTGTVVLEMFLMTWPHGHSGTFKNKKLMWSLVVSYIVGVGSYRFIHHTRKCIHLHCRIGQCSVVLAGWLGIPFWKFWEFCSKFWSFDSFHSIPMLFWGKILFLIEILLLKVRRFFSE